MPTYPNGSAAAGRELPGAHATRPPAPEGAIPTDLAYLLKNRVGLTDEQLAEMSRQAAVKRAQQYWTTGK